MCSVDPSMLHRARRPPSPRRKSKQAAKKHTHKRRSCRVLLFGFLVYLPASLLAVKTVGLSYENQMPHRFQRAFIVSLFSAFLALLHSSLFSVQLSGASSLFFNLFFFCCCSPVLGCSFVCFVCMPFCLVFYSCVILLNEHAVFYYIFLFLL
jgi:hypothetical protein